MAQALKYDVPPAQTTVTKEEELDAVLETLHESGALRVIAGFAGRFEQVSEVVVDRFNRPGGRRAINNLLIALSALAELDSDRFSRLAQSMTNGADAAADSFEEEPPNLIGLLRRLNDAETRRGLHAVLTFLQTVGRQMHSAETHK